ncbi:MAG: DsbA family protein [Deltaproteobacteria bacterium]
MADASETRPDDPTGRPSRLVVAAILASLLLSAAFLVSGPMRPEKVAADPSEFTDAQKRGIEQVVKDYLLKHPEVLVEVQGALEQKMAKEEADRTKQLVAENAKEIYRHPDAPVAGNPKGDITVVEFFDYNCGYCKRGFHNIRELIEKDGNVRVVFKELPILSKDSEEAAKVALAARAQGKYWELHQALIESKGRVTEAFALETAGKLGLDVAKLKADKDSEAVKAELARVEALARKMNITGTPHFLVGNEAIGGAPDDLLDILTTKIAALRKTGCAYC